MIDKRERRNIILCMRTSILLDDELGERFRKAARERGQSLGGFLAEAGRAALRSEQVKTESGFELVTFMGSGPVRGVDLDRTSDLLAAEDSEVYG